MPFYRKTASGLQEIRGNRKRIDGTLAPISPLPKVISGVFPRASWLNTPLTASPVLDPNSSSLAGRIAGYNKVAITYDYANPVYHVTQADPLKTVQITSPYGINYHNLQTRIPANAVAASGSDGWAVFVDPTPRTGYPYGVVDNYWQFNPNGGGTGIPTASASGRYAREGDGTDQRVAHFDDNDSWFTAAKANGYIYSNEAATEYLYNNPLTQGTASGVSVYAGLITPADIAAGVIKHTLVCAMNPDVIGGPQRKGPYRYPGYSTDSFNAGYTPGQQWIMGSRLRFPPSWTPPAGMDTATRIIGVAIRDYGLVITDMAPGGGVSIGCQRAITSEEQAAYAAVGMGQGTGYYGVNGLPWDQIQTLKRWDGTENGTSARIIGGGALPEPAPTPTPVITNILTQSFSSNIGDWKVAGGTPSATVAYSTEQTDGGAGSMKITSLSGVTQAKAERGSAITPIVNGGTYRLRCRVYSVNTARPVAITMSEQDSGGGYAGFGGAASTTIPANTWTQYEGTYTCGTAAAAQALPGVYVDLAGTAGGEVVYVSSIQIDKTN